MFDLQPTLLWIFFNPDLLTLLPFVFLLILLPSLSKSYVTKQRITRSPFMSSHTSSSPIFPCHDNFHCPCSRSRIISCAVAFVSSNLTYATRSFSYTICVILWKSFSTSFRFHASPLVTLHHWCAFHHEHVWAEYVLFPETSVIPPITWNSLTLKFPSCRRKHFAFCSVQSPSSGK